MQLSKSKPARLPLLDYSQQYDCLDYMLTRYNQVIAGQHVPGITPREKQVQSISNLNTVFNIQVG